MAKRTIEKLFSDLSEEEIAEGAPSLAFSFDGSFYEIDLTDSERAEFAGLLSRYIEAARKVPSTGRRTTKSAKKDPATDARAIRIWAAENGIDVPSRGRIPGAIVESFHAAR